MDDWAEESVVFEHVGVVEAQREVR